MVMMRFLMRKARIFCWGEKEREKGKKEREGEKRKYVLSHPRVLAVHGLALSSGCLDHQHVQGMPSVLLVAELTLYRGGVSEQVRQYPHQLSKFLRQLRGARRHYLHATRSPAVRAWGC